MVSTLVWGEFDQALDLGNGESWETFVDVLDAVAEFKAVRDCIGVDRGTRKLFHAEQFCRVGKMLAGFVACVLFSCGSSCGFYKVFMPCCSEWGF